MPQSRVALVTNVNSFVGLAAARALADDGARVLCHDAAFADANPGLGPVHAPEPRALIALLASDRGGFITGRVLPVDGGWA